MTDSMFPNALAIFHLNLSEARDVLPFPPQTLSSHFCEGTLSLPQREVLSEICPWFISKLHHDHSLDTLI